MSNKLVVYFSASGVTRNIAETLAEVVNADLYEIKPKVPYTNEDLDWSNKKSRSTLEMQDKQSRPEICHKDANVIAYDVVFVGFPIWWYIAPTIINTFLESYDFKGKTVVLFATSMSSGFGKSEEFLKGSIDKSAKIIGGKVFKGVQPKDTLLTWVKTLPI